MKTSRILKKLTAVAAALLLVMLSPCVLAAEPSQMTLEMPGDEYSAGDIVTASVYIYNAEFNVAGFSLQYDTSVMEPVTAEGNAPENGAQAVRLSGLYDQVNETGTFVPLEQSLNSNTGRMSATFYVSPSVDASVTADSGGMLVAEISFKMLTDGQPSAEFKTDPDSVDYDVVPCRIINNGMQMETAEATVILGEEHTQTVDISQSVITETEQGGQTGDTEDGNGVGEPDGNGGIADEPDGDNAEANGENEEDSSSDSSGNDVKNPEYRLHIIIALACVAVVVVTIVAVRTVNKNKNKKM